MKNFLSVLALVFAFARPASATEFGGNNYVEYCVQGSCAIAVFDKYGNFGVLIREGAKLGNMLLGDVWKMGPSGDPVARIREPYYQILKSAGLERIDKNPYENSGAITDLNREVQKNANKCLWLLAGCVTGAAAGVGSWYGVAAAVVACAIVAMECDDLHATNQQLLKQRQQLQDEMDAEIEKENGVEDDDKGGGAGGGESGGRPSTGGEKGIPEVPPRGTVTITEGPGAGGGGGSGKPIILN